VDAVLEWLGETLVLMPERAVHWPRLRTLVVADVHLGQDTALRAAAMPVPVDATGRDLDRLGRAAARAGAVRLVVLGDLVHGPTGLTGAVLRVLGEWRQGHAGLEIVLVPGNHDDRCDLGPVLAALGARCAGPEPCGPFLFAHEPGASPDGYVLAGHIHPGVVLRGAGRQRETLRCFHFGRECAVLPAFGCLTGLVPVRPRRGDRVFVLADGEVIEAR
jgi:DNA ligase-associated metallophosphoesterase